MLDTVGFTSNLVAGINPVIPNFEWFLFEDIVIQLVKNLLVVCGTGRIVTILHELAAELNPEPV
jgi:hypothetical protein